MLPCLPGDCLRLCVLATAPRCTTAAIVGLWALPEAAGSVLAIRLQPPEAGPPYVRSLCWRRSLAGKMLSKKTQGETDRQRAQAETVAAGAAAHEARYALARRLTEVGARRLGRRRLHPS